jgi:hypothetical protein
MLPANNPVVIRLGKLADSRQTGVLELSGDARGRIHMSRGVIIHADSRLAPDLATRLARAETSARRGAVSSLERSWIAREATVDAATELLSGKPRHTRFRTPEQLDPADLADIPVAALVSEVGRRHTIIQQLSAVLTPDTAVARNLRLGSRAVHVSDLQWAIVVRAGNPAAPRSLALELGQSVFGTTVEVFRMVTMGLLSVVDDPARPRDGAGETSRARHAMSFIRALAR